MTQEDKKLLLKDLCTRLPYEVKGLYYSTVMSLHMVDPFDNYHPLYCVTKSGSEYIGIDEFKPYLFPLSSMTEEQFVELKVFADLIYESDRLELVEWDDNYKTLEFWLEEVPSYCVIKVFDWLNKNHFDYRGLIEKGLALDATDKNIY